MLVATGAVSMVAWMVAAGCMTVYFRKGMVADWGEDFTTIIEYVFVSGWMIPIGVLTLIDVMHTRQKKSIGG
mgnify:CR=1 FL=1